MKLIESLMILFQIELNNVSGLHPLRKKLLFFLVDLSFFGRDLFFYSAPKKNMKYFVEFFKHMKPYLMNNKSRKQQQIWLAICITCCDQREIKKVDKTEIHVYSCSLSEFRLPQWALLPFTRHFFQKLAISWVFHFLP